MALHCTADPRCEGLVGQQYTSGINRMRSPHWHSGVLKFSDIKLQSTNLEASKKPLGKGSYQLIVQLPKTGEGCVGRLL